MQPPSRGCVLKHIIAIVQIMKKQAAAFARLCVETTVTNYNMTICKKAAAFARLCVETGRTAYTKPSKPKQPPSRGCVLKHIVDFGNIGFQRAATFGWLCVETILSPAVVIPAYAAALAWL